MANITNVFGKGSVKSGEGLLNDLAKDLGVTLTSISVEPSAPDLIINSDDLPYAQLPSGPKFTISIETDSDGLKRMQKMIKETPVDDKVQLRKELMTMAEVNACDGNGIKEKAENYLKKKDEQARVIKEELEKKGPRKKGKETITHYKLKYR